MKICSCCKEEKSYDRFYKDKTAGDGYNSKCKDCRRKADQERRKNDPEWVQKRKLQNRQHHQKNREQIRERKREWFTSKKGKESHRRSSAKWKAENREKVLAHKAVERAVKRGDLIPAEKCQLCGSEYRIEAHHSDYAQRLSVIWLCKVCHEKFT